MHVHIIILHYINPRDTIDCVTSLLASDYQEFTIHLVINGTKDRFEEYQNHPKILVYTLTHNLGFAGGNNFILQKLLAFESDFVWLVNNDTTIPKTTLSHVVHFCKCHFGIIGCKPLIYDHPTTMDHYGGIWNHQRLTFDLIGYRQHKDWDSDKIHHLDYVTGCSLFAPIKIFQRVGILDERFFCYFEEADFCLRAKKAGFSIFVCKNAILYHKISRSLSSPSLQKKYFFWRNRHLFIENQFKGQKGYLWIRLRLLRSVARLTFSTWLKSLVYLVARFSQDPELKERRKTRLQAYQASIRGVHDYYKRKFF